MENNYVSELLHYCNVKVKKSIKIEKREIDYYDFTFVLEGKLIYISDNEVIELQANDALFLTPGSIRERVQLDSPCHYVSFNFKSSFMNFPYEKYIHNCISSEIRKIVEVYPFSHISNFYNSKEKCQNILNYILLELDNFYDLKSVNCHVLKIIRYIDENIKNPVSLSKISSYVNLSKEYICAIFKKETGKTIIEYINEKKLLLAKEMILNKDMTLSEISENLGFENYNYFSRLFKNHFGVTANQVKHSLHN